MEIDYKKLNSELESIIVKIIRGAFPNDNEEKIMKIAAYTVKFRKEGGFTWQEVLRIMALTKDLNSSTNLSDYVHKVK